MAFDCPKCNKAGAGVLLFNSVAPCDDCMGYKPTKVTKSVARFQMVTSVELRSILKTRTPKRVAFGCGMSSHPGDLQDVKKLVDEGNSSNEAPKFYWDTKMLVELANDYHDNKLHVIDWGE